MRGRKPLPTHLKLLTGNPGKRPLNLTEPTPPAALPDCPAHLSAPAKSEWARLTQELLALGLLTQMDRAALASYCQAYGRWVAAEEKIEQSGVLVKSKTGVPIQNPYLSIANRAMEQMTSIGSEFGLTPSSRSRIKGAAPQGDDAQQKRFFG